MLIASMKGQLRAKTKVRSKKNKGGKPSLDTYGDQLSSVAVRGTGATLHLIPETQAFAAVLSDPFNTMDIPVKMPVFPVLDTVTIRTFQYDATLILGTKGFGWVTVAPAAMLSNNLGGLRITNALYTGDGASVVGLPVPGQYSDTAPNGPFTNAQFTQGPTPYLLGRLISVGLEVQPLDPALTRTGRYHSIAMPGKQSLITTGVSHDSMATFTQCRVTQVNSPQGGPSPCILTRPIVAAADTRYVSYVGGVGWVFDDTNDVNNITDDNDHWMGVSIFGPIGALFTVKMVCAAEVYGKAAGPLATRAPPDSFGYQYVAAEHAERTAGPMAISGPRAAVRAPSVTRLLKGIADYAIRNSSHIAAGAAKVAPMLLKLV